MIELTLKDGSVRQAEAGQSAAEVIKGIGMGLYKAACCVKINGEVKDLRTVLTADCSFEVAKLGPAPIRFAVWPCDCFGNRGKVLKGEYKCLHP